MSVPDLPAGDHSHLRAPTVARVERPPEDTLGMCGYLAPYEAVGR